MKYSTQYRWLLVQRIGFQGTRTCFYERHQSSLKALWEVSSTPFFFLLTLRTSCMHMAEAVLGGGMLWRHWFPAQVISSASANDFASSAWPGPPAPFITSVIPLVFFPFKKPEHCYPLLS